MPTLSRSVACPMPPSVQSRLVSSDGRSLPLCETTLSSQASAGLARTVVSQRFANPHHEPLRVSYQLPLPADAAISGFEFQLGEQRIVGYVDKRQLARERFEEALLDGKSAALVEEERSSLFTQEVGNVPPHSEVHVSVTIDHPLRWLPEGGWEWRFPTVVGARYLGGEGRVADAERVATSITDNDTARCKLELTVGDRLEATTAVSSTSHALLQRESDGRRVVALADEDARLDRDVVAHWSVSQPEPGLALDLARPEATAPNADSAYALLTLVPPAEVRQSLPRDLIVLLDTSGSMAGEPLRQAQQVVATLIDGLCDRDQLELIEFSQRPRRFQQGPVPAGPEQRRKAQQWLSSLRAGGGTEMRTGILQALNSLRPEAQRQVLLVTDGLIGFEREIVRAVAERLPAGCRVHTLGIGSSVNRSLTSAVARAGRGLEQIADLNADVGPLAERLLARLQEPVVVDVSVEGSALRHRGKEFAPDLMAGSPTLLPLEIDPAGGDLIVRGRCAEGLWEQRVSVPPLTPGAGNARVAALYARERVEDLEIQVALGKARGPLDHAIERIGLDFQISTRLTSWVAISASQQVDPTEPTRRVTQPQAMPHGMSAEGLGLRQARALPGQFLAGAAMPPPMAAPEPARPSPAPAAHKPPSAPQSKGVIRRRRVTSKCKIAPKRVPTPVWRGLVVLQKPEQLVVEASVPSTISWQLPTLVVLELEDGVSVTCHVVPEQSTTSQTLEFGQVVRLVLVTANLQTRVRAVTVAKVRIELEQFQSA